MLTLLEEREVLSLRGAATIRSTTLGVSVGTALSVQPRLGEVNQEAFEAIDWAVWAAKSCVVLALLGIASS